MPHVVIRPTVMEYGIHRDAYNDFAAALRAEGIEARIDQPPEKRSGMQFASAEVAVYLFEHADNVLAAAVIAKAMLATVGKLRPGAKQPPGERRGAIFDQDDTLVYEIVLGRGEGHD